MKFGIWDSFVCVDMSCMCEDKFCPQICRLCEGIISKYQPSNLNMHFPRLGLNHIMGYNSCRGRRTKQIIYLYTNSVGWVCLWSGVWLDRKTGTLLSKNMLNHIKCYDSCMQEKADKANGQTARNWEQAVTGHQGRVTMRFGRKCLNNTWVVRNIFRTMKYTCDGAGHVQSPQ